MSISLIWAQNARGVIGVDGDLPWHISEDLARFRELTRGKPVVMGRATWDSLPASVRPLPDRRNIVLTRDAEWEAPGAEAVDSVARALELIEDQPAWVIGGGEIYRQFLPLAQHCHITVVDLPDVRGTTFAPELGEQWRRVRQEPELGWHVSKSNIRYRFEFYERESPERAVV